MRPSSSNPLLSDLKSSQAQVHVILHPLVLLTISDYITRHTLRRQDGPIIGALLGQQNGREVTVEHAFECHTQPAPDVDGGYLIDAAKFAARLELMVTVHKERQLDLVGWYTLVPMSGPTRTILPIYNQVLQGWNQSAILLGFHPQEALDSSAGGKLPLTMYESTYETDESTSEQHDDEDKTMDDGGPSGTASLKIKLREVPYTVETDETEMICMNYITAAGHASSATAAKSDKPGLSVESNGKGKRRLVESENELAQVASHSAIDDYSLSRDEEETLASLTTKANAIKMLYARIRLISTYLKRLPPSFVHGSDSIDTDVEHSVPSLTILRQIQALVWRLGLVIPSNKQQAFDFEMTKERNDVELINLLSAVMQGVSQAAQVGRKFSIVESARPSNRRAQQDYAASSPYNMPGSGDLFI
ncbi:hypothetical protein CDD81_1005 [Ophiocordyceps australis]|uniref:COP9 signalosome complex subunit 6 n=1 Tax=Ophiocordyceps australis TaxID=1399860 RepID=A0A2C5XFP9_9HYPO|nr:hypothetical protein CDD81_1005 [Ophiocordyceps australis]